MASGPYYQSVPPDQTAADDLRITHGLLGVDYGHLAPQASMYPDPAHSQMNNDYHGQHLGETEAEDHAQLQGLVEAATSAAAQEQIRQQSQHQQHQHQHQHQHQLPVFAPTHQDPHDSSEQDLATLLRDNSAATKRKRSISHDSRIDPSTSLAQERPKRQKRATRSTPNAEDAGDQSMHMFQQPMDSPHQLDARAAGVHSAAALFRPPSDSSKKYTRPPMSKLFSSLQLSPENFLHLQAAAKKFMLDPEHPERQTYVGNRGRTDGEMGKLDLHKCVRKFLETGGWGQKYFSEDAPPPGDGDGPVENRRRFYWPGESDRIVALCTPLLRRMVTNERQRQYAVESRKGGAKPEKQAGADTATGTNDGQEATSNTGSKSAEPMAAPTANYDPRLPPGTAYQVYMLSRETKQHLRPRADYLPHDEPSWTALTTELLRAWYESMQMEPPPDVAPAATAADMPDMFDIKVLTSSGLTAVSNEGEWQLACQDAKQTVWLEGLVKVVVDCAG